MYIIENAIVIKAVDVLLASGARISVKPLDRTFETNYFIQRASIIKALDESYGRTYLQVRRADLDDSFVRIEWGNGVDVIVDFSASLAEEMAEVMEWIESLEDRKRALPIAAKLAKISTRSN